MLHLAFKLARVMAPTVIYIDEIEKVRQKGTVQSRREKYGSILYMSVEREKVGIVDVDEGWHLSAILNASVNLLLDPFTPNRGLKRFERFCETVKLSRLAFQSLVHGGGRFLILAS